MSREVFDLDADVAAIKSAKPKGDGCFNCKHLSRQTESWEMPHVWWYECEARHANEYLLGFPWRQTKCKLRIARGAP